LFCVLETGCGTRLLPFWVLPYDGINTLEIRAQLKLGDLNDEITFIGNDIDGVGLGDDGAIGERPAGFAAGAPAEIHSVLCSVAWNASGRST
jgi:hypothetical protein